ncbi:MAG: co-chaperone GroES [Oscillospiraceae bacterium]|nr:co-chaperone GroES [Oscillospiraceae bacterium]
MKLRPLSNKIVLKKAEKEQTTKSGLILSANVADDMPCYEVIAVGPGLVHDGAVQPMTLKVGEKVFIDKFAGSAVKLDGVEYLIAQENDVLAVIE